MGIQIGKFTLESLTTGMYSEPEMCYREYIQNAVDAIDVAIHENILEPNNARIDVIINASKQEIQIIDNGSGIKSSITESILLDIGNSTKIHTSNRGFRGIGRLGGLSYCKKLIFTTSAKGERLKTVVTFDGEKLRDILVPKHTKEASLQDVIASVTKVNVEPEEEHTHYFRVTMTGVDEMSSLLDLEFIHDYLSQVAPVPYKDRFVLTSTIHKMMSDAEKPISEYSIFISDTLSTPKQIFKLYKNNFDANSKAAVTKDSIKGSTSFAITEPNGHSLAYGWYANTDFSGTLVDERISGIRLRQGNILIGNQNTLSQYFKERRFNMWVIGEIFVVSTKLIPNARRDDFEKNDALLYMTDQLRQKVFPEIAEKIRAASKIRNNPDQKIIKKVTEKIEKANNVLTTGFHSTTDKEKLASEIYEAKKELYIIPKNAPIDVVEQKQKLASQLKIIEVAIEDSKDYKLKRDLPSNYSKDEKKVIQAMLEVLSRNFERDTVESLYQEFLTEIQSGGKK